LEGSTGWATVPGITEVALECCAAFEPLGAPGPVAGAGLGAGVFAGVSLAGAALAGDALGAGVPVWVAGTGVSGNPEPCFGDAGFVWAYARATVSQNNKPTESGERFIVLCQSHRVQNQLDACSSNSDGSFPTL